METQTWIWKVLGRKAFITALQGPSPSWMGSWGVESELASLSRTSSQSISAIVRRKGLSMPASCAHNVPSSLVFPGDVTGSPITCFLTWPFCSQRGRIISYLVSISSDLCLAWPSHNPVRASRSAVGRLLVMAQAGAPEVPFRRKSFSSELC